MLVTALVGLLAVSLAPAAGAHSVASTHENGDGDCDDRGETKLEVGDPAAPPHIHICVKQW